jgi:hypothetical protein
MEGRINSICFHMILVLPKPHLCRLTTAFRLFCRNKRTRLIICAQRYGLQLLLTCCVLGCRAVELAAGCQLFGKVTIGARSGKGVYGAHSYVSMCLMVDIESVEPALGCDCAGFDDMPFSCHHELLQADVCAVPGVEGDY